MMSLIGVIEISDSFLAAFTGCVGAAGAGCPPILSPIALKDMRPTYWKMLSLCWNGPNSEIVIWRVLTPKCTVLSSRTGAREFSNEVRLFSNSKCPIRCYSSAEIASRGRKNSSTRDEIMVSCERNCKVLIRTG